MVPDLPAVELLFPVLDDEDDVDDAGEEELCDAAPDVEFCPPAAVGDIADDADDRTDADDCVVFLDNGDDVLLVGCEEVLKSCGELMPFVVDAEVDSAVSAYLQLAVVLLRLVTDVLLLLRMGDTAPGDGTPWWCNGCKWPTPPSLWLCEDAVCSCV